MELFNEIFSRNYIEVTKLLNKIAENNGIKKTDLNSLNQYRSDIVESLVDKGVDVNENSSMADITSGITNLSTESDYVLLGIASWDNSSADTLTYTCTNDGILLIAKDVNMDVQINGTATAHD